MPDAPNTESVLDQLATPILIVAAGDVVRAANPAFAGWMSLSVRRFLDQPIGALSPDDATLAQLVARARSTRQPVRAHRLRCAPSLDHERFADVTATPLVTARAPLPDESHADDDGVDVVLEFYPAGEFPGADPATTVPVALHEALKGLAHEIRNPLAGLRGAAQLLARRVDDGDARRYLDVITAEADRLGALVERLLHPRSTRAHEPVNVHEVLERVRLLAEADAGWSVVIQRDYDPSLPPLPGDADALVQAIWNLVLNALQAGSTEVRLRTRAESNVLIGDQVLRLVVRIEVADNGHGVPDALASRIFLPLVSGRAQGTGLGLPQAQQVAREHRGALSFRSRAGHTVFTLLLPVEDADG